MVDVEACMNLTSVILGQTFESNPFGYHTTDIKDHVGVTINECRFTFLCNIVCISALSFRVKLTYNFYTEVHYQ